MWRNRVPSCRTGNGEGLLGEFGVGSGNRECVGAVGGGTYRQWDVLVFWLLQVCLYMLCIECCEVILFPVI